MNKQIKKCDKKLVKASIKSAWKKDDVADSSVAKSGTTTTVKKVEQAQLNTGSDKCKKTTQNSAEKSLLLDTNEKKTPKLQIFPQLSTKIALSSYKKAEKSIVQSD